ncbi:hypothetical protein NEIRO02_0457 [Nematocida sp. AWRm79]|nr:hypothetical protein NEIRO02_0457 [Nematocida sp. AWRm79]
MTVKCPKLAKGNNDTEKVRFVFPDEIFSVHTGKEMLVVLLNGKVFKKQERTAEITEIPEDKRYVEIFDLKEVIKHTETIDKKVYIITPTTLYRTSISGEQEKESTLYTLHKDDFSKTCAFSITEDESMMVYGDYEGKITVKQEDGQYDYTEHEDAIVDIVILKRVIFTASEDGMLLKTKIGETEPKDAYEIGKPIRYLGKLDNKMVILDAYGTPYVLSKAINDLKKEKKLTRKITDVQKIHNALYVSHNNEYYRITTYKSATKIQIPAKRIDGLFVYKNQLYFYAGEEVSGWDVKKPTELEEFFEDL